MPSWKVYKGSWEKIATLFSFRIMHSAIAFQIHIVSPRKELFRNFNRKGSEFISVKTECEKWRPTHGNFNPVKMHAALKLASESSRTILDLPTNKKLWNNFIGRYISGQARFVWKSRKNQRNRGTESRTLSIREFLASYSEPWNSSSFKCVRNYYQMLSYGIFC